MSTQNTNMSMDIVKSPIEEFPKDVLNYLFGFFSTRKLHQLCRVSHTFEKIAKPNIAKRPPLKTDYSKGCNTTILLNCPGYDQITVLSNNLVLCVSSSDRALTLLDIKAGQVVHHYSLESKIFNNSGFYLLPNENEVVFTYEPLDHLLDDLREVTAKLNLETGEITKLKTQLRFVIYRPNFAPVFLNDSTIVSPNGRSFTAIDINNGNVIMQFNLDPNTKAYAFTPMIWDKEILLGTTCAEVGRYASGKKMESWKISMWDRETGQYINTLIGEHDSEIIKLVKINDDELLSVSKRQIYQWNIRTGQRLSSIYHATSDDRRISDVAMMPDGIHMATASPRGLKVLNLKTKQQFFYPMNGWKKALCVLSDGQLLISYDGNLALKRFAPLEDKLLSETEKSATSDQSHEETKYCLKK